MTRLDRLLERRNPDAMLTKSARAFTATFSAPMAEAWQEIRESDSVRYALGAMQPIDPTYTKNTFAQGDRVKACLSKTLTCDFAYQGSTTNDTHIKAHSDIDLLVLTKEWNFVEPPQKPAYPYQGDTKADLKKLRGDCTDKISSQFPEAEVDDSGGKAVAVSGGSLTRQIDVVPGSWVDTNAYVNLNDPVYRGVKLFDKKTQDFTPTNQPFLHNHEVDLRDTQTSGGLRKASRLMKSLKYDADLEISSYDIVGIAYNIPAADLRVNNLENLKIVDVCYNYCINLQQDPTLRNAIKVPNNTRLVFSPEGATLAKLDKLVAGLYELRRDILQENVRSFTKLAEARIEYPR